MTKSGDDNKKSGVKVGVYNIANRLKIKLGRDPKDETDGHLDPEAIAEADRLIEELCEDCPETVGGYLDELNALWKDMRDMKQSKEREDIAQKVFTLAHEIKDISAMCGYELAAFFAESLRDFVGKTELKLDAQRVIIQAHIDALNVTQREGIKDEGGPAAEELKTVVKIAIDKYS